MSCGKRPATTASSREVLDNFIPPGEYTGCYYVEFRSLDEFVEGTHVQDYIAWGLKIRDGVFDKVVTFRGWNNNMDGWVRVFGRDAFKLTIKSLKELGQCHSSENEDKPLLVGKLDWRGMRPVPAGQDAFMEEIPGWVMKTKIHATDDWTSFTIGLQSFGPDGQGPSGIDTNAVEDWVRQDQRADLFLLRVHALNQDRSIVFIMFAHKDGP
ncbi:hypothetical protein GE09DRAFT_1051428 [Coniochaeta sp. 2T2.1]|nr:hypothetical protein GE09DRAFT_1051428 [Coniochaeta sp. 2T2.1]